MKSTIRFATLALGLAAASAHAQIATYDFDLAGFTAAGGAGVAVDFDSTPDETAFEGMSLAGATFHGPKSPLFVVDGNQTVTPDDFDGIYKLFPTSGNNVLSPGGKDLGFDLAVQQDAIDVSFAAPIRSFGFDMLFQSDDFLTFARVQFYDASNNLLLDYGLPANPNAGGGGAPGGAEFYGFISTNTDISRIVISEGDDDSSNPDANIGIDTLRFEAVPEPASLAALGLGAAAMLRRRRK